MPQISVIIPCFNLGEFIGEAIDSVLAQTFQDFEIIVVNDGSTDSLTNQVLNNIHHPKIRVICTTNQGPSSARNTGISQSVGKYILPLDADDKIATTYLEKASATLNGNNRLGIVYCQAEFFGEKNDKWDLPEYTLPRILIDNLIFSSALFHRKDWEIVGGYKSNMSMGWEDYDFWLSIIELEKEVYRIPEYLFYYRIRKDSRSAFIREKIIYKLYKELANNHKDLYINNIEHIFEYIYLLRETISKASDQQIAKDTQIHKLNLAAIELHSRITELSESISDEKFLLRQMFRLLKKKFFPKSKNTF
jgi:glycosyltransferase involved in cell wall biosynthesis